MEIDTILIEARPGQIRVALLADGRLVDLVLAREDLATVSGNLYLGRVEKVVPRLDAAFVDIGLGRSGFLALPEARPPNTEGGGDTIGDYLAEGDRIMVQVLRDPEADKGAKLTTRLSLPGRYAVFLPSEPGVRLSRKIEDRDARTRLTGWGETVAGEEGLLLRTAALAAGEDGLAREVDALRETWTEIEGAADAAKPPACLHVAEEPVRRALRDFAGPALIRVVVDGLGVRAGLEAYCRAWMPGLVDALADHVGPEPLFEAEGVEEQIEAALEPRVALPSGGDVVVAETEALVAVDVNAGGARSGGREETALAVNLEAAAVLAGQLRLRNLAGLVVVDFLRMKKPGNHKKVLDALRSAVADDPAAVNVAGFTTLGLVELTRRKRGESLSRLLGASCPQCRGAGLVAAPLTVAYEILRRIPREARAMPGKALRVRAAPVVVGALNGPALAALREIEGGLGRALVLEPDAALAADVYEIVPIG